MFIYNVKLNGTKIFKILLFVIIIFVLFLCGVVAYRLYKSTIKVKDSINDSGTICLTNENYSTILKAVHENIDDYIGQKFKFSGYVYRVYDLDKDQFILARNMIISSDMQTVIVGFLCNYDKSIELKDYSWVEIEGRITKGNYHGEMPILKIEKIKTIARPDNELVYPPDENYIPTSVIL